MLAVTVRLLLFNDAMLGTRVPPLRVMPPVKELAPLRVSWPVPAFTRASAPPPVPSRMMPGKVLAVPSVLPIVREAGVALAFSMIVAPGVVALVLRLLTTTLFPPKVRVLVLPAPKVTAFSDPAVLLSAPALPSTTFPELMNRPPVKVLAPERVRVPAPDLVRAVAPVLLAMFEAMVRPFEVLFWMIARSLLAAPANVPPVMVERLLPTVLVTKIPPEVMTLVVPVKVTVLAPAVLKRRLLAAITASRVPALLSTSILLFV